MTAKYNEQVIGMSIFHTSPLKPGLKRLHCAVELRVKLQRRHNEVKVDPPCVQL